MNNEFSAIVDDNKRSKNNDANEPTDELAWRLTLYTLFCCYVLSGYVSLLKRKKKKRRDERKLVYVVASDRCRPMSNISDMFRYVHFFFSRFLTEH